MSNDSINIRLSKIEESLVNSINRNTNFLGKVVQSNTSIDDSLKNVSGRELNFDGYAQVLLTSAGGTAVKADTDCVVQEDPEHRMGWNLINQVGGTKFNLHYFNGNQEIITLNQIQSVYFKGFINVNSETSSMPFIHIYTKPTGSGDAGPFYHSKIDYEYNLDNSIGIGEECIFYGEGEPKTKFTNRNIQFNNKTVTGDGNPTEEILYIVVSSNSGATAGAVNVTLNTLGFDASAGNIGNFDIYRNLVLISESSLTGGATEAKQDDMITELNSIDTNTGIVSGAVVAGEMRVNISTDDVGLATESTLSSVDGKISRGNDFTLSEAQQVLVYGEVTSGPGTGELHPIHITNSGDVEVEIADMVKGQNTMNQSFPVVIASDQSAINSKLIANYNSSDIEVKADMSGRLCVQVDAMRASSSETFTVADGTTGYSSSISMGTHKYIAFYGDTDNTTNTNIFIEYSQDNVNFYRGAGDNAKIIIVSASGNFYDEEHVTPPFVRLARPNTSGGLETIELKYTRL